MEGGPNDPKQRPLYGASAPAVDPACGPSVPPADAKPAALGPFGQSMATSAPSSIRVNGIPVSFPFTPYRSQYAMMHNIVKVVREKQHALVEVWQLSLAARTLWLLAYGDWTEQDKRLSISIHSPLRPSSVFRVHSMLLLLSRFLCPASPSCNLLSSAV